MRSSIILTFLTALFSLNTFAQSTEHTDNHEHHNNEIGIANGPVYFLKEKVLSYGLHIHYIRKISHSKSVGEPWWRGGETTCPPTILIEIFFLKIYV